jgi:hypothetical protein
MKKLLFIFVLQAFFQAYAQPTAGTTGLLNIPTADMQPDGTFMFGGNYLPASVTPGMLSYDTGNYYLNITFLPFCEVNYRCTLLQTKSTGDYNMQDRSFSLRLRLLQEQRLLPSFVIGGNDIYTSSNKGNQYFGAAYLVSTKHFCIGFIKIGTTVGYGFDTLRNSAYKGILGGITLGINFWEPFQIIAEYDTNAVNIGASLKLFKHLNLYSFACDGKYFCGGLQYCLCLLN